MSPNVKAPRPAVASAAPGTSSRCSIVSSRLSGTPRHAIANTSSVSGRLMTNTHRHDACCASHPPSTGPIAPIIEPKPDHVPIARPRSVPVNVALISASDSGIAHAAPIPCTHRAAIKACTSPANAHAADASANTVRPARNRRLRP